MIAFLSVSSPDEFDPGSAGGALVQFLNHSECDNSLYGAKTAYSWNGIGWTIQKTPPRIKKAPESTFDKASRESYESIMRQYGSRNKYSRRNIRLR